jgi:predicted aconitase
MYLTPEESAMLEGQRGEAAAMAMRILADMAHIQGAEKLISIASAHIDGCLYHGASGAAFAEQLVARGARVAVHSSLNVGALDLQHPDRVRLGGRERDLARRQMNAYVAMGCTPTWTCAPYQAGHRPKMGQDVAWAESNAIVFANSVLGARTNRYGDFMDICCAITGRAPFVGLHRPENRFATLHVDTAAVPDGLKKEDVFYAVLGSWLGRIAGDRVAVFSGLPANVTEDQLKSLGASAASSGGVALFHIVGVTPEAPTLAAAINHQPDCETIVVTLEAIIDERDRLSTAAGSQLDVVAVGSPHFSFEEFMELLRLLDGRRCVIPLLACTGRHVISRLEEQGQLRTLEDLGVEVIVDTCVVVTPILERSSGVLMTNSGKFAHYSPSLTGHEVVFGSLADCANSAVAGVVRRDESGWG